MWKKLLVLVPAVFLFSACEIPIHGSGTGEIEGPYIVESVLASGINDDGFPIGITDEFYPGGDVYLWILWEDYREYHQVNVVWLKPSGSIFVQDSIMTSGDGLKVTYFMIHLSQVSERGEWEVQVYLDNEFRRSLYFYVND